MCLESWHRWCSECSSAAAPKHTTSKAVLLLRRPAHKGLYPPGNWVKQLFWWGCRAARVTHSKGSRFAHLCKNRVWCHIQLCFTSLDLMARNTFITATAETIALIDKWHTYPLTIQWAAQRPTTTMLWVYYFAFFPWSLLIAYLLFLHWDV